ncbi:hypothetical protein NNC19_09615 [Clostridium sp. SHJSY1]|uniref:hypothetical protein n=1 Tax=Clostridium sp. SHJSY1 TaxID=2942483 RepID=UPI0028770C6A|nr:hypothetical protein [Clostridium sp. SHJSY1]MDS0525934.1 hypothetical protein [Clostridium sp. SHJSY1]
MKMKRILSLSLVVSTVFLGSFATNTFASEKNSNIDTTYLVKGNGNGNNGNGKGNGQGQGQGNKGNNHNIKIHKHAQTIIKFDGELIDIKTINQGAKTLKELRYEINVYDTSGNMMGDGTIKINVGELLPKRVAKNALIFTNVDYIEFTVIAVDDDGETYTTTQKVYNKQ